MFHFVERRSTYQSLGSKYAHNAVFGKVELAIAQRNTAEEPRAGNSTTGFLAALKGEGAMSSVCFESYVDADVAARHLSITRKRLLGLARRGLVRAYPVDPTRQRKTYRFKLGELDEDVKKGSFESDRNVVP